jgi:prepilin-type N-terminal cleavage/methylation domain-containing protein
MSKKRLRDAGFTIVELLIVIVVIAILVAIVIVAYNGVQARASDSKRQTDIATIAKKLELFYVDNGYYPPFSQPVNIGLSIASWRSANLSSTSDSLFTPPGAGGVSLVNSDTPSKTQYGYRNGGSCVQCSKFYLYWRSDATGDVQTSLSANGQ